MTKSRFDDDVRGKPYLTNLLKSSMKKMTVENLFMKANLSRVDFFKQLDFELKQKLIVEHDGELEAARAIEYGPHRSYSKRFLSTPSPSTSTSQTSPDCRKRGGLRAVPTPGGVPVKIRSPGSSTQHCDK